MGYLWFETSERTNYDDVIKFCKNMNSSLIEIDSEEQFDYVANKLLTITEHVEGAERSKVWWGGATDKDEEGTWRWTQSGVTFDKDSYIWAPGEPSNGGANKDEHYFCFWRRNGSQTTQRWLPTSQKNTGPL